MGHLSNGINELHLAYSHAVYEGFPVIEYEDRDWELYHKTKEDKRIVKQRKHSEHDIEIYAMFAQTWGSTALGFGGLGGQAITNAYTIVLESRYDGSYCVYFGGRFAYRIIQPNENFFADTMKRSMHRVAGAKEYYERKD